MNNTRDFIELHSLTAVSTSGGTICMYFRNVATLLEARAAMASAYPDVNVETSNGNSFSILFEDPLEVTDFIGLWLGANASAVESEDSTEGMSRGDELEVLLRRPTGVSLDELAELWGIKRESAAATLSVQSRKRDLKVTRENGRYRIA